MKKVLVVDDELTLQALVADVLRDEGYAVITANDGREALALVASEAPDLVLMDVMMPGMDGPTALRALRATPAGASTPVVLTSALVARDGLDRGIDGFLPKPYDLEALLGLVARLVGLPEGPV